MIALSLILLPISTLQSTAFFYPFEAEGSATQPIDEVTQHQVSQLVKYNLGLLEHSPPDQEDKFRKIISSFGKGNLLTPTMMTYLMIIESNKLIAEQEKQQARVTEGYSDTVQIVQKTDKSVLDMLFSENGKAGFS